MCESNLEWAKMLWDEWKYRHDRFWRSLFRFASAVIIVSIVPYVKPELIEKLGNVIVVFPVLAILISLGACWLLAAEYQRLRMVGKRYDDLRGNYVPPRMPSKKWWQKVLKWSIGWVVALSFGIAFVALSIVNIFVLLRLLERQ